MKSRLSTQSFVFRSLDGKAVTINKTLKNRGLSQDRSANRNTLTRYKRLAPKVKCDEKSDRIEQLKRNFFQFIEYQSRGKEIDVEEYNKIMIAKNPHTAILNVLEYQRKYGLDFNAIQDEEKEFRKFWIELFAESEFVEKEFGFRIKSRYSKRSTMVQFAILRISSSRSF